jgi:hypothetical protein
MDTQEKNSTNFVLKGFSSILIGGFIFTGTFAIRNILKTFTKDTSFLRIITTQNVHYFIFLIIILVFIASTITFYISEKRSTKNLNLWNLKTNKLTLRMMLILATIILLFSKGFVHLITPIFLVFYGVILFILKNKEDKNLLIIVGICLFLGLICFLIPSYWYSSLSLLGIAHITYGIVVKD